MILGENSLRAFGANVAAARKKRGMTQEELADKLGISQAMINYIESGKKKPSLETALTIAKVFGTTVDNLMVTA